MALAKDLVGGGFSAGQAKAVGGGINSAVAAAGTTLATATALTASVNIVTTVAASSGVTLPNGETSDSVLVANNTGTNNLTVYPPTASGTINQLGAGVGVLVGPYRTCLFFKTSSTAWWGHLSA